MLMKFMLWKTLIFEFVPAVDMALIETEMSATEEFPAAHQTLIIKGVVVGSETPIIKGIYAQDLGPHASIENVESMANVYDSYDTVLADSKKHVIQAEVPALEVTIPATDDISPTRNR
jgi:hypothetical protein